MADVETTFDHVTIRGHRVAVRRGGEGPTLLLVHGMAGSSTTWAHALPHLARRFTVIAPDLLGHGASDKPREGEYSISQHAGLLRDVLKALGAERATFVGQSYGGGVAMQLAHQFPELCERLVLVGSGGLGREVHLILRALSLPGADFLFPFVCTTAVRDAVGWLAGWLQRAGFRAAPAVEETWRSYGSLTDADARHAFFRTLRAVVDFNGQTMTAMDRLHLAERLPSLIVWGTADTFIPVSHAHAAHTAITGSRLEIYEGVGHYPHCEVPERFAELLADFVSSTEAACFTAEALGASGSSGDSPDVSAS